MFSCKQNLFVYNIYQNGYLHLIKLTIDYNSIYTFMIINKIFSLKFYIAGVRVCTVVVCTVQSIFDKSPKRKRMRKRILWKLGTSIIYSLFDPGNLPGSGEKVSLRGLVSGEYSSIPSEESGDLRPFSPTADNAEVTFLLLKIFF